MTQGKFSYSDWISKRSLRLKFFKVELHCVLEHKYTLHYKIPSGKEHIGTLLPSRLEVFVIDKGALNLGTWMGGWLGAFSPISA